jgi:hypothetical protein
MLNNTLPGDSLETLACSYRIEIWDVPMGVGPRMMALPLTRCKSVAGTELASTNMSGKSPEVGTVGATVGLAGGAGVGLELGAGVGGDTAAVGVGVGVGVGPGVGVGVGSNTVVVGLGLGAGVGGDTAAVGVGVGSNTVVVGLGLGAGVGMVLAGAGEGPPFTIVKVYATAQRRLPSRFFWSNSSATIV